ncbi:MAG: hypothetical protein BGP03_16140 [Pseudonocardia sp. 73-21]|nr:MAG: hypothetical protein BGP03_16140 [Pseudonocardia sp. 73-21]
MLSAQPGRCTVNAAHADSRRDAGPSRSQTGQSCATPSGYQRVHDDPGASAATAYVPARHRCSSIAARIPAARPARSRPAAGSPNGVVVEALLGLRVVEQVLGVVDGDHRRPSRRPQPGPDRVGDGVEIPRTGRRNPAAPGSARVHAATSDRNGPAWAAVES